MPAKPTVIEQTPRKASREVRRQQLIDATIATLARVGFSRTTLTEVAATAGLSHGLIIFHFETKEKLLTETLQFMAREYRDNGAAVAAGVAGLAAGALIAGAIASQAQAQPAAPPPPGTVDPSVAAYCARKYRSYDPATGTFLAHNGMRYVCTYP